MLRKKCFAINSYFQFEELIKRNKDTKKTIIIYIKYYLIKGFEIDWLNSLIYQINKNYKTYKIKFYIDSGTDYGLSLQIMREKIHYLKLRSNTIILNKINQIAKKNKVVLNPDFDVVHLKNIKNY